MSAVRTGIGWDSHKLVADRKLILGGVELEHSHGLLGHSDADVLTHAIIDALLGAAGLDDIGAHFPDTDAAYKDADSLVLLRDVVERVAGAGFRIDHVDTTVIMERPKLVAAPRRDPGHAGRGARCRRRAGQREGVDRRGPRLRRPGRGGRRAGGRHAELGRTPAVLAFRTHARRTGGPRGPGRGRRLPPARRADADPVPDPADGRRDRAGLRPGRRRVRPGPRHHPRRVPAAAALRRRVLHLDPGSARQLQADRAARGRAGHRDDGHGRRRRPRGRRPAVGRGVRARRGRLADRSGRRRRDRRSLARAAPAGDDRRGRVADQRLDRPHRLQVRGRRRAVGHVLALVGARRVRPQRGRRRRARPRDRLGGRRAAQAPRRRSDRDGRLAADAVPGLPARRGAGHLGRAGRRERRPLPRLALARAGDAVDADPDRGLLGDPHLRAERRALRAHRPAAAHGDRRPGRVLDG